MSHYETYGYIAVIFPILVILWFWLTVKIALGNSRGDD